MQSLIGTLLQTPILENPAWIEMLHSYYHPTSESPTPLKCINQVWLNYTDNSKNSIS